ncbi:acylphosphatase [Halothece sp. PCC 7418]|uniref:acylphosphatase n=1 Tax=Halothece sp. (strain PCC 7418) TaxID=65093 RepID=UPI0002A0635A|nr:acylphosphatase [Halothece sp. PCC 7418]AFZ43834.1 acylphosphatase [Halothece sp. PCC 7418]
MVRAHVYISGKVQGVGYRLSTQSEAVKLGIKGWVRNVFDGSVEAVFEGEPKAVDQMIQWCHQGPPAAVVRDVQVEYETPEGFSQFQVAA